MAAPDNESFVTAIVAALFTGGGLAALIGGWFNKRKNDAEAVLAHANADKLIIGSALEFVNTLKGEVVEMREKIDTLETHINKLENHIRSQGGFIVRLLDVIRVVKPDHPILQEKTPIIDL